MSQHVKDFWEGLANNSNYKDALVGWYDAHNEDANEELILFDGIPADKENALALDFGCGPGRCIIKFSHRFKRIDGVDISPSILEKAKIDTGVLAPNLYLTNGHNLDGIADNTYDVVYSIICMQHISDRSWRLELYREFARVLKAKGHLRFQMGFGPGHGISRDYFHEYQEGETYHHDTRVEDPDLLRKDLSDNGFDDINFVFTAPCHDQHPQWIWVSAQKKD